MAKFAFFTLFSLICIAMGQTGPTARVVGGTYAYEGQFPHQISLRRNGSHTCGGSIISRYFVLTAAHCVVGSDATSFNVRAGSQNRFRGGVLVDVKEITIHEDYGNFLNDIALLRLAQPLIFSKNIQPVKLASKEVPSGSPIIISGWGRLKAGGDLPEKLQWNTLTAISQSECKDAIDFDSETLICLAHNVDNGACNGDSGGPALYNGELVGLAGFVVNGCGNRFPDGYAKVYYHVKWIREHSDL